MEFSHKPVFLNECIESLNIRANGIYVDGTLGGGGHSEAICAKLGKEGLLIGIDRDGDAIAAAKERLKNAGCRTLFVRSNYSDIKDVLRELEIDKIDGAMLDLGVSSFQLDNPERGFSYMNDAPLDMRMDQSEKLTAYEVINDYEKRQIANIIRAYGEERWSSRIADFIVKARREKPIETTFELVDIIKSAIPAAARREGPHPAKRTFQAIRIEVNGELEGLKSAVNDFMDVLSPEGRLAIISFHSLEDRIVKEAFVKAEEPCTCPKNIPVCVCGKVPSIRRITRKPILPSEEECDSNPRARSAKLRVCEKL